MGMIGHRNNIAALVTALLSIAALVAGACSSSTENPAQSTETTDSSSTSNESTDSASPDNEPNDGASNDQFAPLPSEYSDYTSEIYSDDARWLCKPGIAENICDRSLDTTIIAADGSTEVKQVAPAEDPPIDCFYVYPTASNDNAPNSDFDIADGEEVFTTYSQAARFETVCDVYAPIYRQLTVSSITGGQTPDPNGADPRQIAYDDVVDAFHQFMANRDNDRGYVVTGHSQGSGILTQLLAEEIEPSEALRDRLVAAHLYGTSPQTPPGSPVGGTFSKIPMCEQLDQTGCVASYASYSVDDPPGANGIFAKNDDGMESMCVNPVDPALGNDGAVVSSSYLLDATGGRPATPFEDPATTEEITAPWVTYEDLLTATCVATDTHHFLQLEATGVEPGGRTDDVGGVLLPGWGTHIIDMNATLDNLVALVDAQGRSFSGR